MPLRGMEDKRRRDKNELRELAFVDDLTEIYNRRYLYQYLPVELKDVGEVKEELSLFMIDVDTFKQINDAYGHLCGDKILVKVAQILRECLREGDTIVRYAGDEFIAVLPGAKEAMAITIAERIINKVNKTSFKLREDTPDIHVTISIGLAVFPRDAQNPDSLIHQADRALYSAKRSGRNCVGTVKDIPAEVLGEIRIEEILPCPQLIGRQEQLARLKQLLDESETSQARFAMVKGERGIGKTRLISELKKYAQTKGVTNINASCSAEISTQPYQILIKALEGLFTLMGPEVREFIRSLPEAQMVELANYIPYLKGFLPEDLQKAKAAQGEEAQIDLFKGMCQSLIYIVKRNIFLLIVDDFHWIDIQTLQLFNYIIKELRNIPLFIVAAYREDELEARKDSPTLLELMQKIKEDALAEELTLGHLEKEEIEQMIAAIFSELNLPLESVDIIYDVCGGNPLFTEEVLRSLINKGLISYQDGRWHAREITQATLPPFLKEAIQKRITELDEETKPVMLAAAVIGQGFDFEVLCKVLGKDPGYVLEIIDRATKEHLIMPESPFQSDRFKFNSGAIRDIIYNGIDSAKKQDLHRRLALIEESIYHDNIDSVAATLGYHFDKAQDTQKADKYAQMLLEKSSRMPTYEDIVGFLQDALLERVEEIVVPLSAQGMKLVPAMVRSLKLAAQNVRLYPEQSSIRKGFVNQAFKYLNDILAKDSSLLVATAEGRLLINGEEISEKATRAAGAKTFVSLLIGHRVKGVNFKQGLSKEHLEIFLECFGQNYDELLAAGGLSSVLKNKGLSLIQVNEVRYEQTSKLAKQRTQFEEAMLLDYLMGKAANLEGDQSAVITQVAADPVRLAATLRQITEQAVVQQGPGRLQEPAHIIAQGLQKLSEQVLSQTKIGAKQYQKNIAEAMMALDYNIRSQLIQAQIQAPLGKAHSAVNDIIGDAIKEISDEEILKMLAEEFKQSGKNLGNIRKLAHKFLLDAARRERLAPKMKAKLAELGLGEEEVSWTLGEGLWAKLPAKEKAQRIKTLSAENYLKLEVSKEIEKLMPQLLENVEYEEAGQILEKLIKQLEDESKQLRNTSVKDLANISLTLINKEKYFLLEQAINGLIARLDKEKDPEVYSSCVQALANICAKLIEKENFIQATGILREFNLRLDKQSKLLEIQKQALKSAKAKIIISPAVIQQIIKLLKERIESHYDFWELSKVIIELGAAIIEPIFNLAASQDAYIDPFKTYALRWNVAKVLKGIGDEAIYFLKDKLANEKIEENKAALELFGHIQNKKAVRYLAHLLRHEDLELRKEAIITLGKVGGDEAIELLAESIQDEDSQIRYACLRALANIGTKEVLPALRLMLKDRDLGEEAGRLIQRIEKK